MDMVDYKLDKKGGDLQSKKSKNINKKLGGDVPMTHKSNYCYKNSIFY